jgi:hypothetical protein
MNKKPFYYEISIDEGKTWIRSKQRFSDAGRAAEDLSSDLVIHILDQTTPWGRIGKVKANEA